MNRALIGASACVCLSLASCQLVFEIRDYVVVEETTATGGGGAGGGAGGQGGSDLACTPLTLRPCYSGPEGTEAVGLCEAGAETCNPDGTGWGTCTGEKLPDVELCAEATDENCDGYDCGIWAVIAGDTGVQRAQDIEVDKDGNVIVVGSFEGVVDFGGGPLESAGGEDFFVLKLDPNGKHLWSKRYGNDKDQSQVRVAVDAERNVIVAGTLNGTMEIEGSGFDTAGSNDGLTDVFAVKLTPEGGLAWKNRWGGDGAQGEVDVAVDPAGDVVLSGGFTFKITLKKSYTSVWTEDVFVMKASGSNGAALWEIAFSDGALDAHRVPIAADGLGNIYMTGAFTAPESGIPGLSCTAPLYYLSKLSPDGVPVWAKCFELGAAPSTISADGDGNTLVGSPSAVLRKVDPTGEQVWVKEYGLTPWTELAVQAALTSDGDAVVALANDGPLDFGGGMLAGGGAQDLFVARYASDGKHQWSKVFGDAGSQHAAFIAVGPDETASVACNLNGKMDVGTGALVSKNEDVAVFKLGR